MLEPCSDSEPFSLCPCVLDPWPSYSSWEVEEGLCGQWECSPPSPTMCALPWCPHHMHNHARRLSISWPPSLLMEDDWECRLWEEMTIFIVWIKYFSWPSCYLVTVLLFPPFPFSLIPYPLFASLLPPLFLTLPQQSSTQRNSEEKETPRMGSAVQGN